MNQRRNQSVDPGLIDVVWEDEWGHLDDEWFDQYIDDLNA